MINKPLVSTVIASYNMATYLPLAVESALAQTYENIEVLVIDDGSTDDTRRVIEPFLDNSRVRSLFQTNKGQAAAKNYGIRESRGEYIAFLDADDIWALDKLEAQIPLFLQSPAVGVVYSRFACIDEKGVEFQVSNNNHFRGRVSGPLLIYNFIGFGTSVVRKKCFERLGGFKENIPMGIDYDLWLRLSTCYEFDYVDRPLLYYRVWPGQMSKNYKGRYFNGINIMKRFLTEFPGIIDKKTEDEAWAHTFVGYGECIRRYERQIGPALSLYMRALRHKPHYLPAWKSIIKTILNM